MALETPSRPPPFMANAILNFHFDYLTPSLSDWQTQSTIPDKLRVSDWQSEWPGQLLHFLRCLVFVFFPDFFSSNFVISGAKYDYGLLQWQIMKARSDGKDWWRWSRGVQKDFKPPGVHCPLPCNLVLGVAWIWWRESRTMHISQEGPLG